MSVEIDRKFETWEIKTLDGRSHAVDIRYKREKADSETVFYASVPLPIGTGTTRVQDTDAWKLRCGIQAVLDAAMDITWTRLLLVCVGAPELFQPGNVRLAQGGFKKLVTEGISFGVYAYEQGVAANGEKFWRCLSSSRFGYLDGEGNRWDIKHGVPYDDSKDRTVGQESGKYEVSIIEDTAQNRQSLELMATAFKGLLDSAIPAVRSMKKK